MKHLNYLLSINIDIHGELRLTNRKLLYYAIIYDRLDLVVKLTELNMNWRWKYYDAIYLSISKNKYEILKFLLKFHENLDSKKYFYAFNIFHKSNIDMRIFECLLNHFPNVNPRKLKDKYQRVYNNYQFEIQQRKRIGIKPIRK